jgi:hypothetical protein
LCRKSAIEWPTSMILDREDNNKICFIRRRRELNLICLEFMGTTGSFHECFSKMIDFWMTSSYILSEKKSFQWRKVQNANYCHCTDSHLTANGCYKKNGVIFLLSLSTHRAHLFTKKFLVQNGVYKMTIWFDTVSKLNKHRNILKFFPSHIISPGRLEVLFQMAQEWAWLV